MSGPWNLSRNSLRNARSILARADRLGDAAAWSGASHLRFGSGTYPVPVSLLLPAFGGMGGGVNFAYDLTDANARLAFDNVDSNDGLKTLLTHRSDHPQLGNYARITANATAYATIRSHFDPSPSHVTSGLGVLYRLITRINATTAQLSGGLLSLTNEDGSAELKFSTGASGRLDVDYTNGTDTGVQQQFVASPLLTALTNGTTQDVVVRAYYTPAKDQLVWEVYADTYGTQVPGFTRLHRGTFTVTPTAITSGKEWSRDVIAAGFVGNSNAISHDIMARDVAPAYDGSNKLRSSLLFAGTGITGDAVMNGGASMSGAGTETNFANGSMNAFTSMSGTYAITQNDASGGMSIFASLSGDATQKITAAGLMGAGSTMQGTAQIANFANGAMNAGGSVLATGTQTIFASGVMNAGMKSTDTHDVYIDMLTGDDSNDGTAAHPWRSFTKVQYLSAGYKVWLGRDNIFYDTLTIPTSDIQVATRPGVGGLARITAADPVTSWTLYTGQADRLVYTPWSLAAKANYDFSGVRVVRLVIPAGAISVNGDKIAITIRAGTANGTCGIDDVQIGQKAASGNEYDMTGTLTRITFNGGQTGCSLPQGTRLKSDIVSVAGGIDGTKSYVLSYRENGAWAGWGSTSVTQVLGSNLTKTYYKPNAVLADVTALIPTTGYTFVQDIFSIEKVETYNVVSPSNVWFANVPTTPSALRIGTVRGSNVSMLGDVQSDKQWTYNAGLVYLYSATTPTNVSATVRNNAVVANNADRFALLDVTTDAGTSDVVSITGGVACTLTNVKATNGNARGIYFASPNGSCVGCECANNMAEGAVGDALNVSLDVYAHDNGADGVVADTGTSGAFIASGRWRNNTATGLRVKSGGALVTAKNFDAMANGSQGVRIDSAALGSLIARGTVAGNQGEGILFTGTANGDIRDTLTFSNGLQDGATLTTYQVSNQGTGTVTADYCNFALNARVLNLYNTFNISLGAHMNVGGPGPFTTRRRDGVIMLTIDDWGSFAVMDAIAPYAAARGYYLTWGINTKAATAASGGGGWAKIAGHLAAGHCIACHSRSHAMLTDTNMLSIRYTGAGTTATVSISGNVLTTVVDGVTDHTINLATVTNDALQNVVSTINSWANYTAVLIATNSLNTSPKNLADLAASDIKATRTLVVDQTRFWNDEIVGAKADIEANLPGYTCDMFITPYTANSPAVLAAIKAAGFRACRNGNATTGGRSPAVTTIDLMDIWGYDAPRDMPGQVNTGNIQANTGTLVEWIHMVGGFATLYAHDASTYSIASWQTVIDELVRRNANVMKMDTAVNWVVANGTSSDGGRTYTRTWPDIAYNYTPRVGSPLIDAGVNIPSVTDGYFGLAPDIGAYELAMNTGAATMSAGASMLGAGVQKNAASGTMAGGLTLSDRYPDLIWNLTYYEPVLAWTILPVDIQPDDHYASDAETAYAGID